MPSFLRRAGGDERVSSKEVAYAFINYLDIQEIKVIKIT